MVIPGYQFKTYSHTTFNTLKGLTFERVYKDEYTIYFVGGRVFKLHHEQDCCENVYIDDVSGDLSDLEGAPILLAEEISDAKMGPLNGDESFTWTFYKIATAKGHVTIRFYGTSNGYYSENAMLTEGERIKWH